MTGSKLPHRLLVLKDDAAPLDGMMDRAHEDVTDEWLRQEIDWPRLHGPHRHRHIAVARDEDDGHLNPVRSDTLLQLETIKVRKTHVEYEAARADDQRAAQELLGGRERLGSPPCGLDQQFQ